MGIRRAIFPWSERRTHDEFTDVPEPWVQMGEPRAAWEARHAAGAPVDGCACWSCDGHRRSLGARCEPR